MANELERRTQVELELIAEMEYKKQEVLTALFSTFTQ